MTDATVEAGLRRHTLTADGRDYVIFNAANDTLLAWSLDQEHTWEPWQIDLYARLLGPGAVCLDVGANIGTSAICMAHFAPGGTVYSFEPVPYTYEILRRNLAVNGVTAVAALNLGLSDREKTARILVNKALLGDAHQVPDHVTAGGEGAEGDQFVADMRLVALDDFMRDNAVPEPALIKVDVEGFETEVLAGGRRTFRACRGTVSIFEFSIFAQRAASGEAFERNTRDLEFFLLLRDTFEHVFLIGRDGRLFRVTSYAELRAFMLRHYLVEDLLCCHVVPPALEPLIAPAGDVCTAGPAQTLAGADETIVLVNRHADGWSGPSSNGPGTRVAIRVARGAPGRVALRFGSIAPTAVTPPEPRVMVVAGDCMRHLRLGPEDVRCAVPMPAGSGWILLESDFEMPAAGYFGNPGDHRRIGFRVEIEGYERRF